MRYTITFSDGATFVFYSWEYKNAELIEAIENWLKEN